MRLIFGNTTPFILLVGLCIVPWVQGFSAEGDTSPRIASGETIVFVGGMVRAQAYDYDRCVLTGLEAIGIEVQSLSPAVFRDANTETILSEFNNEVIKKNPQWVVLALISDKKKLTLTDKSYAALVEHTDSMVRTARAAKCRVVLISSGLCYQKADNPTHGLLSSYNTHLKALAGDSGIHYVDLYSIMKKHSDLEAQARAQGGEAASGDLYRGSYARMNPNYHSLLATQVLRALGLVDDEIIKASTAIGDIPMKLQRSETVPVTMSLDTFRSLRALQKEKAFDAHYHACLAAAVEGKLIGTEQNKAGIAKETNNSAKKDSDPIDTQNIAIGNGERVVFLGDSITAGYPCGGYLSAVVLGLKANGIEIKAINAGVPSHTAAAMLARFDKSVLATKADWMLLNCGVNDAAQNVTMDTFRSNVMQIVSRAEEAGMKVMLVGPTMRDEDSKHEFSRRVADYTQIMRELALQKKLPFADLYSLMAQRVAAVRKTDGTEGRILTVDSAHMNPAGNAMMAEGILAAFGLDQRQMSRARLAMGAQPVTMKYRFDPVARIADFARYNSLPRSQRAAISRSVADYILSQVNTKF